MPPPAGTLRVGRYFLALLGLLAILYGLVFLPGKKHTPELGLDLKGGAQIVYQAKSVNGKTPTKSQMNEARSIIDKRVNGLGVANSEVVVNYPDRITVSVPGKRASDLKDVGRAAVLNFRGLVMPAVILSPPTNTTPTSSGSGTPTASSSASSSATHNATVSPGNTSSSAHGFLDRPHAAPSGTTTPAASASSTPSGSSSSTPSGSSSSASSQRVANPLKGLTFPIPTTEDAYNKLTQAQQQQLQAAMATLDCGSTQDEQDVAKSYFLACDTNSNSTAQLSYLLGPVIVPGHEIASANAVAPNPAAGLLQWAVDLTLHSTGQANWAKYTAAHNIGGQNSSTVNITNCGPSSLPCADFVAFTLDGVAISTPVNESAINGGTTQITGGGANGFTQSSAKDLANALKYGALPVSFKQLTSQTVSATLGTTQLKAGFLAGGIGLILVVLYSLIYYRALGLVTIASLLVSAGLTFACLVILGREIGFTLTLAGIAGFIVAVGITADSFVVFFERIKDEVHEGRTVRVGIPRAWVRARRTILSADTVSFLAAAILYYFAAGDVKGFAFTLGMSTVLDLVVVFLFTHPTVSILSRSKTFASARMTGLNHVREGGIAVAEPPRAARAPRAEPSPRRRAGRTQDASPVSVLDAPADGSLPVDDAPDETPDRMPDTTPDTDVTARRQVTPEPGTAAERAAARRARMRAERGNN